jgi:hypothetical protein
MSHLTVASPSVSKRRYILQWLRWEAVTMPWLLFAHLGITPAASAKLLAPTPVASAC